MPMPAEQPNRRSGRSAAKPSLVKFTKEGNITTALHRTGAAASIVIQAGASSATPIRACTASKISGCTRRRPLSDISDTHPGCRIAAKTAGIGALSDYPTPSDQQRAVPAKNGGSGPRCCARVGIGRPARPRRLGFAAAALRPRIHKRCPPVQQVGTAVSVPYDVRVLMLQRLPNGVPQTSVLWTCENALGAVLCTDGAGSLIPPPRAARAQHLAPMLRFQDRQHSPSA
jgi:hypothetical protein